MPCGHTGRTVTTYFAPMGGDDTADSPSESSSLIHRQPLSAKQQSAKPSGNGPKDLTPSLTAVIERWICFVLGLVCIACGAFAMFANHTEKPLSASTTWLGSAYMPALRITALLCVVMGSLLVRHGWSSPNRE